MPRPGQKSAEGFNLMLYRNEKTGREEWLWNSRDGVTPFIIPDAEDGGDMKHDDWFRDVFAPFHIPPVGSRIFVDMTEVRARALAARNAQRWWEEDVAEARSRYESPEVMAEALWPGYMGPGMGPNGEEGGVAPDILVVNSAMQEEFRARQPPPRRPNPRRFA